MKKILILTLCAAMLLSCFLTGCNTLSDPAESTGAATTAEDTTKRETETQEPATTEEDTMEDVTAAETESKTEPETEPQPEVGITRSISSVTIVAGDSAPEAFAAAELRRYLEMKGVSIVDDGYPITLRIDPALGDDSYKIQVFRKNKDGTKITGGNDRGVIYGMYRFLEEQAGIRFLTPDLEVIPEGEMRITTGSLEHNTVFSYRFTNWVCTMDAAWRVKNGINGNTDVFLSDEVGGGIHYGGGFAHTMAALTGTPSNTQPCLTDPAILQKAIESVRAILEQDPTANIVSVSQNDNQEYCKCDGCTAIAEEEGSQSGPLIRFVNAIANDIAEDYPNVTIDTLAYMYTRKAPAITKPAPNVCIRLAPIEICYTHSILSDACTYVENAAFAETLIEWSKICDNIYIWEYSTNFSYYIPTYENLVTLRENMAFYATHNVKGTFTQGNIQSPSGEFAELRSYLLVKLMMDPLMSEKKFQQHMDDFLKGYYGEGWMYIRAYIDMTTAQGARGCRGIYSHPFSGADSKAVALAMEDSYESWWDQAEALAGDRLPYVQRSRLQWRYIRLLLHPNEEEARAFIADVKAAGIRWNETSTLSDESNLSLPPDQWIYK